MLYNAHFAKFIKASIMDRRYFVVATLHFHKLHFVSIGLALKLKYVYIQYMNSQKIYTFIMYIQFCV